jgi:hypothetical protein
MEGKQLEGSLPERVRCSRGPLSDPTSHLGYAALDCSPATDMNASQTRAS